MLKNEMGRTGKALENISYNLFNQIITIVLSFVSRTVFIWGFGVEYLGINGLFGDILSLLSMADLGFNTAMTYSFYKPLAEKDYTKISQLTNFYKKVYNIIAIVIAILGICLVPFLPYLVKLNSEVPNLVIYYLLSLSSVVVSYLCVYRTTILTADQRGFIITKITIITNTLKTIFQIISILILKNYIIYLAIGTIITIANNLYVSYVASKEYPFIKNKSESLSNFEKKNIFSNLKSVFLYKISSVLLNATDNILISTLLGTAMVGYYSNYLLLQTKITTIISLIFTSMTASIGHLVVTEGNKKRYEIFQCEQSISFLICGIVVPCYVLLVDDFIKLWLGVSYELGFIVSCAIGLNMYLSCVLQPLWSYREATGLYRRTKWVMIICSVINLVLSVFLGKLFGIFGIIIASGIARISTYVWYEPHILFREYFGTHEKIYYLQIFRNIFLIVFMILIGKIIGDFFYVSSFFWWIQKAIVLGITTMLIVFFVYGGNKGIMIFKKKVQDIFINFKR